MENATTVVVPNLGFTFDPANLAFAVNKQTYLSNIPDATYSYICTGALVFNLTDATTPRILLIQRSASDSMPYEWEIPGGACDDEDPSILHAVARELKEEADLKATHIGGLVGEPYIFVTRSQKVVCKFNFMVEVERDNKGRLEPRLNPAEHRRFLWVSEDEVKGKKARVENIKFTFAEVQATLLDAFRRVRTL